jgi:hypothetical protein
MPPSFAVVEDAAHHDSKRAGVCTGQLVQGDILVADRAYLGTSGVGPLEIAGTDPKNLSVFAIFGFCEASASVAAHERRGGCGAATFRWCCAVAAYNLGVLYYNRGEKGKAEKFFSEAKKNGYNLK